jgi:hypothetical protein
VNGATDVGKTVLVLACALLFSSTACTTGAPTSTGTSEPAPGVSQPASAEPTSAPSTTLTPTASPAPRFGAWKRLANQPTFERAEINDVVEGGPGYVAVGCDRSSKVVNEERPCTAAAWTSRDGLTWTRSTHVAGARDAYMEAVTLSGPGFVAVGTQARGATSDAAIWTSTDGVGWSRVPLSEGFKYASASAVVVFGAGLVATGESYPGQGGSPAAVWSSTNGREWRRENTDEFQRPTGSFSGNALGVIGDRLILSGSQGGICAGVCRREIWTSEDGARWTRAPDSPTFDGAVTLRPELDFNGRLLASGFVAPVEGLAGDVPQTRAALWSSADGVAWEQVTVPAPKRSAMGHILSLDPGLIAVGTVQDASGNVSQAITWTSTDGRNWKLEAADPALRGTGIRNMLVTGQGLIAFGARQLDGPSEHTGIWLRPFEAA